MTRFALSFVAVSFVAGCSDPLDPVTSCDQAEEILASCESAAQVECLDSSPAAQFVASGKCADSGGKSDTFGNRTWGEACTFNWQCQQDTRHSCNHGTCYLRAEVDQACDRGDDADCETNLSCADNLATPTDPDGVCARTSAPVRPPLGKETLRPNEKTEFQEQVQDIMGIQIRAAMQRLNGTDQILRTFHAKRHLCSVGSFETLAAPADLAVGPVFSSPQTFPAYVRLSNGTLTMLPDENTGVQGLAIKLVGVPGPKLLEGQQDAVTQDFLFINLPANAVASSNEFMELTKAQEKGSLALIHYLLTHPRTALRARALTSREITSARTETFWAANASLHGTIAVKYSARPCAGTPAPGPFVGDNFFRDDVKTALATGEICFDFYAQRQTDSVTMSIEDATSEWSETDSVPVRIGRLVIPRTALDTPAATAVETRCNELSFNPWNSSPMYRPLGNMNRARKFAYEASKQMRGAAPEPTEIP